MKEDLHLNMFFFFICQFAFHRVHDLFKEFIISCFAGVICCDSTNAKWIFNYIGMIFLQSNTNKQKWQMSWKKNWTPSLRSTKESTVNENSFRVLSILYIVNFCETRKISCNAIRVLLFLLNFWKIRQCALN